MRLLDGTYIRNMLRLGRDGRGTGSPGSPAALAYHRDDEEIIALMAAATRTQRPQERERGRVAPLLEVLYNLPQTLIDGRISWLLLPGDATPSTIVFHKDLTRGHLILLAPWRLAHVNLEHR